MKHTGRWATFVDALVGLGCVALYCYFEKQNIRKRKLDEKLDSSLVDTFPASDPITY
jgi:hypothetical protein